MDRGYKGVDKEARGRKMKWTYGVTTVPERRYNYLPKTLSSLKEAGFNKPVVFVDGSTGDFESLGLEIVRRSRKLKAYGNWLLTLMELWIRNPHAHRFAIFQDDFLTYKNLKDYLDACPLPDNGYWNLLTFPENEEYCPAGEQGWQLSNQRGRGAVALVFNNLTVFKLLTNEQIIAKPKAKTNPHRSIDGAVIDALTKLKIFEYVHHPTLVHHIGDSSSIGNQQHKKPETFLGVEFDALELTEQRSLPSG